MERFIESTGGEGSDKASVAFLLQMGSFEGLSASGARVPSDPASALLPPCTVNLVAEWIHFRLLGIILPTIKLKVYTFGGLMNSATKLIVKFLPNPADRWQAGQCPESSLAEIASFLAEPSLSFDFVQGFVDGKSDKLLRVLADGIRQELLPTRRETHSLKLKA